MAKVSFLPEKQDVFREFEGGVKSGFFASEDQCSIQLSYGRVLAGSVGLGAGNRN
jgi:hypothetical protein